MRLGWVNLGPWITLLTKLSNETKAILNEFYTNVLTYPEFTQGCLTKEELSTVQKKATCALKALK